MTKLLWWGYRHINGNLQVKRFFDFDDILDAYSSDFVDSVSGPFEASGRQDALYKLSQRV